MPRNVTIDPTLSGDTAGVSYRQLQTAFTWAAGQTAASINGWGGINFNCYSGNIGPASANSWAAGITATCTVQPAVAAAWQDGTANPTQGAYISSSTGASWAGNAALLLISQSHFVVKGLRLNFETATSAYEVGILAYLRGASYLVDDIWIIGNYIDYNPTGTDYHPMAIRAYLDSGGQGANFTAAMTVNVVANIIQGHSPILANENTYGILGSCYAGYSAAYTHNDTLNFNVLHNTIVHHNGDTNSGDTGASIRAQAETDGGGTNYATVNAVWRNNLALRSSTGPYDKCYVIEGSSTYGPAVVNVSGSNNIDNDGTAAGLGMIHCITTDETTVRNAASDLRPAGGSKAIRAGTATSVDGVIVDALGKPFKAAASDIGAFYYAKPAGNLTLLGAG